MFGELSSNVLIKKGLVPSPGLQNDSISTSLISGHDFSTESFRLCCVAVLSLYVGGLLLLFLLLRFSHFFRCPAGLGPDDALSLTVLVDCSRSARTQEKLGQLVVECQRSFGMSSPQPLKDLRFMTSASVVEAGWLVGCTLVLQMLLGQQGIGRVSRVEGKRCSFCG